MDTIRAWDGTEVELHPCPVWCTREHFPAGSPPLKLATRQWKKPFPAA